MAAGMAHEINNPLTGVIGFSDLLLQRDLPENIRKDVTTISNAAQRVAGILQGVLKFSRQHKPEKTYSNVNEIVESVLNMREYQMKLNNIIVIVTYQLMPGLPKTMADAGQLQQL